jgi:hypothetical protein
MAGIDRQDINQENLASIKEISDALIDIDTLHLQAV